MRPSPRPSTEALRASAGLLAAAVAALLSVLLVSGALAPATAAPAAVARTVSAKAGSAAVVARTTVLVSGTVSKSPKGSPVKIQRQSGKKWVVVKNTRTTSAGGAYSARVTVPAKAGVYAFRTAVPSAGRLKSAVSKSFRVTALTRVSFVDWGAIQRTVRAGQVTTFHGIVQPFVAGTTVAIQRLAGSSWATVATAKLKSSGDFSKGVTVTGPNQYRALVPRVGLKAAAASAPVEVRTTPVISTASLPTGYKGRTYSVALKNIGDAGGTWKATGLPAGLSVIGSTIYGRPTGVGSASVTLSFTQTSGGYTAPAAPRTLALTVLDPPKPVISTTALPSVSSGNPYLATLRTTGDAVGTWSADLDTAATGLTLDPATGVISGTAKGAARTITVTVGFTENDNPEPAAAKVLTIAVTPEADPVITTATLPVGGVTKAYDAQLAIAAATDTPAAPGHWSANTLPAGLSLAPTTGRITGTPTAGGTTQVQFTFTQDSTGRVATKTLTLKINALPVISTATLPNGGTGLAYSAQLAATGNPAGSWTAAPLPAGLAVDGAGRITGTPTATGTTQVVVSFTETATGLTATKTLPLNVYDPPVISTTPLPAGGVGKVYSATLTAVGGASGQWTATPLPAGLTLTPGTGVVAGTPTAPGTTQVKIGFTDGSTGLPAAQVTLSIKVIDRPGVATTTLDNAHAGTAYTFQLTASVEAGTPPAGTWSVTGLADGMTYDPATGVISGTPTGFLLPLFYKSVTLTITFTQLSTGLVSAEKQLSMRVYQT